MGKVYEVTVVFRMAAEDGSDAEDKVRDSILHRLEDDVDEITYEIGTFDVRIADSEEV